MQKGIWRKRSSDRTRVKGSGITGPSADQTIPKKDHKNLVRLSLNSAFLFRFFHGPTKEGIYWRY
jgi:hypothetical protein